jgi:hypothetical protein
MPYYTAVRAEMMTSAEVAALDTTDKVSDAIITTRFPWITSNEPPTGIVAVFTK